MGSHFVYNHDICSHIIGYNFVKLALYCYVYYRSRNILTVQQCEGMYNKTVSYSISYEINQCGASSRVQVIERF
jgi:hypothetical protein